MPVWITDLKAPGARGVLAWQALTSSVGVFVGTALMALYLVGPVGMSAGLAAGTLAGSAALTILGTPVAARLIRVLGPRRFAIASCLSRAVLFALLPISTATAWTVALVLLIGLCEAAAFSVYQIIIAEALGEEARTEALAVRRTLGNLGFTVGGLIISVVVGVASREAYAVAFLVCGLSLSVAAVLLLRLPQVQARSVDEAPSDEKSTAWTALRDPRFMGMTAVAAVMASSMALLTVGMPLWVVHETAAPASIVGVLMIVNTVLVVLLQVRLSRSSRTWRGARAAVIVGGLSFAAAAFLMGLSGLVQVMMAVVFLVVATVIAAVAEMLDSAGWWTLSYDYARPAMRSDYLAAFDVITPAVSIAGPPLMVGIVALGPLGWFSYGLVLAAAGGIAALLIATERTAPR